MAVTAELTLKLFANDVVIAESDDAELWRRVFTAVQKGTTRLDPGDGAGDVPHREERTPVEPRGGGDGSAVSRFAREIGLDVDDVVGSADPSSEPPYIHLNPHNWEALKKNTPARGPNAVAGASLAGTLLALWFDLAKLGAPTVAQCSAVLDTIKVPTNNLRRGLENSAWLRLRGDSITLNPSQRSQAARIARAYCGMQKVSDVD